MFLICNLLIFKIIFKQTLNICTFLAVILYTIDYLLQIILIMIVIIFRTKHHISQMEQLCQINGTLYKREN